MSTGIIFIYHRVSDLDRDPHRLAVHPSRFEDQIRYLKNKFAVISLQELLTRISHRQPVKNCVVITFDDGYSDNLYLAKSILEKYSIPATFFITVGMIGSSRELWWDELERIFLSKNITFKPLQIYIDKREHYWDVRSREVARVVFWEIYKLIKNLPHFKREQILCELFNWRGLERDNGRETHRMLNREEILDMSDGELIEIGCHSLTHPVLSNESVKRKWAEIKESKLILEQCIKRKVRSFSYPFGLRREIDEDTIGVVKESGYLCALSNIQGNIDGKNDPYILPRRLVRDWDISEFRHRVNEFLNPDWNGLQSNNTENTADALKCQVKLYLNNIKQYEKNNFKRAGRKKVKNILLINYLDKMGGAAKVGYRIFKNLKNKRYHTEFLVGQKYSLHENINTITNKKTLEQNLLKAFQKQEGLSDVFLLSSFNIKHMPQFKNADVVHLHNLQREYFSILALPEITCLKPVVWTLHDMNAFTGHCNQSFGCTKWERGCGDCPGLNRQPMIQKDNTYLLWELKKIVYEHSNIGVVCPSYWLKSKLKNSIIKEKDVTLIYNGVDEKIFRNHDKKIARKRLNLPVDKPVLLFVASLGVKHKLAKNLIDKVRCNISNKDVLFLCIGKPFNDSDHLINLPYIEDEKKLALYYSAADLFIYPSLADNCPLVVLESLSCGTPVVTFNTGGIPELVQHNVTGYLAEYKNITDLAFGVDCYLKNPYLLKKTSRNARQSVLEKFTLKRMINQYLDLYQYQFNKFIHGSQYLCESYKIKVSQLFRELHR
jgi:glycosyltransferase involved in cell wall biosynthesis/peptidoglycan/xylan/chitin deacetylase (PgdA/CDA1 family)